jgi:hypothetical protein
VYNLLKAQTLEIIMATTSGFNKISFTTSVGIDDEFGLAAWTNPQNASGAPNGTFAQSALIQTSNQNSHWLMGSNFGFAIPTDHRITAAALLVTHRASGSDVTSISHRSIALGSGSVAVLTQAGIGAAAVSGSFVTNRIPFTGNISQFTPAIVNSTGFLVGVAYTGAAVGTHWALVDSIGIELTYELVPPDPYFYKTSTISRIGPMTFKI